MNITICKTTSCSVERYVRNSTNLLLLTGSEERVPSYCNLNDFVIFSSQLLSLLLRKAVQVKSDNLFRSDLISVLS